MASFVCQQCKQPLQLDPSVVDIAPSAHDMIAASLPKHSRRSSGSDFSSKLSQFNVPPDVKASIEHRTRTTSHGSSHMPHPQESFVLLQDSVYPTSPPPRKPASASTPPIARRVASMAPKSAIKPRLSSSPKSTSAVPTSQLKTKVPPTPTTPTKPATPAPAPPPRAPPHKLSSALRLFTMLSSQTEFDHPLCADCTHTLLENLNKQLEETKKERDGYIAFERDVKRQKEAIVAAGSDGEEKAHKRIEALKDEEHDAIERLREAEREKAMLDAELAELEREERALEEEESEFWTEYSASLSTNAQLQDQLTSLQHAQVTTSAELAKLSRTNVYNDAFCIGHDGVFGTINGLRLGTTPNVPVEWSEINAAWGMTLLLLSTIARKVGFTFENYRLVPMGSFSRIERTNGDKSSYELYGLGSLNVLHNRRFNQSMVYFLDCLRQLMDYAKAQDPPEEFPHQVVKDKIGEASIKMMFNQDEAWTRALRHVLLALKVLLRWVTNGNKRD